MSDDKVTRRKFLVDGSVAAVGATAIGGVAQNPKSRAATAAGFVSPDGSTIPFTREELLATGKVRSFSGKPYWAQGRTTPVCSPSRIG